MRNRRRGYAAARVRAPRVVARLGIVRLADSDAITPVPPLRPWVVHVAEPGIVFRDGAYARAVGVLHAKGHLGELDRWGALEEPVGLAASAPRVREKDNDTEEGAAARESAAAVFFELTGIGVDSLAEQLVGETNAVKKLEVVAPRRGLLSACAVVVLAMAAATVLPRKSVGMKLRAAGRGMSARRRD